MTLQPFVYVLVFVAVFVAVEGVLLLLAGRRRSRKGPAARRLRALANRLQAPDLQADESLLRSSAPQQSLSARLYELLPGREALELRLYRAGISTSPLRFVAYSAALSIGGFTVGTILWPDLGIGVGLAFVGLLPWLQATRQASRRMKLFGEQFPEALELLTRALRAGHSLTFSFQLIGEEMPDPIAREFAHLAEEIKLGQDVRTALANLTYRINVGDLPFFSTAVLVQRETGGNLADLLDNLGYVIRDRFKLFGKIQSLTAVGKVTANILGLWPILTIGGLMMVGADFVSILWTTSAGHLLAAIALVLVSIGYVLCRRSAIIEV